MNENRFFLWAKIVIKIKTRDKKKFTKKIHGGGGGQFSKGQFSGGHFSGGQFSLGTIFREAIFRGAFFLEPLSVMGIG